MGGAARGILFVISAPSGTGKSTLARRLLEEVEELEFSVSVTTRSPRKDESDGVQYRFVDEAGFERRIRESAFLEWAEVFGKRYGTEIETTRRMLERRRDVLLDIDVQGARQVRRGPIPAVSIMILPPDFETLRSRLRGRDSETEPERARRLARAREEAEDYRNFDYVVINDSLQNTLNDLVAIVRAERRRSSRCEESARRVLATFPG